MKYERIGSNTDFSEKVLNYLLSGRIPDVLSRFFYDRENDLCYYPRDIFFSAYALHSSDTDSA